MSNAKAVLVARVNDGSGSFPFVNVKIRRNAIVLPVEGKGKVFEPAAILGFYARYPHVVGNCLFPGCIGKVARHVQSLGKDHIDAFAQFQRIERDFTRIREGKLPVEEPKAPTKGRSLEEAISDFESNVKNKQRKPRTVESYSKSLEQFAEFAASSGIKTWSRLTRARC